MTRFAKQYQALVDQEQSRAPSAPNVLLTEAALTPLPPPVQKYLRYTGAVGKPQAHALHAVFTGRLWSKASGPGMPFTAKQYSCLDTLTRIFYMRGHAFGIPVEGLHVFRGPTATMQIRLASLFPLVDAKGPEMNQSETVTLFNDLCLLAPARLLDPRIQWEPLDSLTARAAFTHHEVTIHATLHFDADGALINFSSPDRFLSAEGKRYQHFPWSTPVRNYQAHDDHRIWTEGEAIWHTP